MPEKIEKSISSKLPEPLKTPSQVAEFISRFFLPLIILVALLVLVTGWFWIISPAWNNLSAAQSERDQAALLKTQLAGQDNYFQTNKNALSLFKPTEERLLNMALPDGYDFPSLIIQLTTLSQEAGFVVSDIEVSEPKTKVQPDLGQIKNVNVKLTLAGGNYGNLLTFLGNVENSLMIFDAFSVESNQEKSTYGVTLNAYYYPKSTK